MDDVSVLKDVVFPLFIIYYSHKTKIVLVFMSFYLSMDDIAFYHDNAFFFFFING